MGWYVTMELIVTYPKCYNKCFAIKFTRYFSKHVHFAKIGETKHFKEIPGPIRLPIIGNLYQYKFGKHKVEKYHMVLEDLYKQYGPLVRQDLGTNTIIHVFDPDDIKTVYINEAAGMVCFENRLSSFDDNEAGERAQAMINANKVMFKLSSQLKFSLPIYMYIKTPKWKKLIQAEDFFYGMAVHYINTTIEKIENLIQRNELPEGKYNFLTYLLSRKELNRKDITIITFSLFTDGLSTTVPALLYNLYCLATNPEVQEKAYQEIQDNLKREDVITYSTIQKLSYLKAVVKETFRLYPTGTEISRIIQKDLVLSGYHVPAGSHVNLSPHVHFKSNKYFSRASEFLPERWIRGNETSDVHPYLLTPFGHGVRTCAGMRFAEQDLHVALCSILLNFKLKYPVSEPLEQIYSTLLFPDGPVKVQFISRN
ncbi:probable cytochrome P450 CYP44 isoform X4 [Periplaneta americana]|uniref:probable cytochrome P450 CYP44 isoform X4 n=1 Tax=Periplaneta americana TaxID=6978 RepID=UPI0037E77D4C